MTVSLIAAALLQPEERTVEFMNSTNSLPS